MKYNLNNSYKDFYDLITGYGFLPLILDPTRVTNNSATIIVLYPYDGDVIPLGLIRLGSASR